MRGDFPYALSHTLLSRAAMPIIVCWQIHRGAKFIGNQLMFAAVILSEPRPCFASPCSKHTHTRHTALMLGTSSRLRMPDRDEPRHACVDICLLLGSAEHTALISTHITKASSIIKEPSGRE